jgi:hypothetical protein
MTYATHQHGLQATAGASRALAAACTIVPAIPVPAAYPAPSIWHAANRHAELGLSTITGFRSMGDTKLGTRWLEEPSP